MNDAAERLEQIITYSRDKDKASLRKLFSPNALQEAEDLDADMDDLFALLEEGIDSWEIYTGGALPETYEGRTHVVSRYEFTMISGDNAYRIFLYEVTADSVPGEVGLYMVQLYTPEERDTVYDFGVEKLYAGIILSDMLFDSVHTTIAP